MQLRDGKMPAKTRTQRENELTALLLESRRALHAVYTIIMGTHPPAWKMDRDMIREILAKEFPTQIPQADTKPN